VPIARAIAAETRLLCFDEFQVTNIADAMILGRLFETCSTRGVTVIATSNRVPDDLYKNGLQRDRFLPFIALLKQRVEILELGGERDYRLDRLRNLDVYLTPLGAWADKKLDEAFLRHERRRRRRAARAAHPGPRRRVPRAAPGVAMAHYRRLVRQADGRGRFPVHRRQLPHRDPGRDPEMGRTTRTRRRASSP
jgi:cell division protein ZapE